MNSVVAVLLVTLAAVAALPKPDAVLPFRSLSPLTRHPATLVQSEAPLRTNPHVIRLLSRDEIHDPSGQFELRYETENGIMVMEKGHLVPSLDNKGYVLVKSGSYSYPGSDGKIYTTSYTSGLDGFVAEGEHLPRAPHA